MQFTGADRSPLTALIGQFAMPERVQKILSQWGFASRRQAEQMILAGRVRLNGKSVQLGQRADPNCDQLEVDGVIVQLQGRPQPIYLLLHKPLGVVSTCRDPQAKTTVLDCLPYPLQKQQGIHPVGRLDVDSTGALLLTNNGDLTFYLTHPRHHIAKTYEVWVQGLPPLSILRQWQQGVILEGRKTLPAGVKVLRHQGNQTCLEVVLKEGRNRQIRRVAAQLGYPVIHLHRTAIGPICLQPPNQPPLPSGSYRYLTDSEIDFLSSRIDSDGLRPFAERLHRGTVGHREPALFKENRL
jgi:23S rRNA pseudouridine2605 synthase